MNLLNYRWYDLGTLFRKSR